MKKFIVYYLICWGVTVAVGAIICGVVWLGVSHLIIWLVIISMVIVHFSIMSAYKEYCKDDSDDPESRSTKALNDYKSQYSSSDKTCNSDETTKDNLTQCPFWPGCKKVAKFQATFFPDQA